MSLRGRRIALYSHDAVGIGHVRRNLLLARALAGAGASVLLVSGAQEACGFEPPAGVDLLTLPALRKEGTGRYVPRRLAIEATDLLAVREAVLAGALRSFRPDALVVDKLPGGVCGELLPALRALRSVETGRRARCVLGLRDVLDEAAVMRREWARDRCDELLAEFYDGVWVYGDRAVYDPVREYALSPEVEAKVSFTGYLDPVRPSPAPATGQHRAEVLASIGVRLPEGVRLAVCAVGGGEDGGAVAAAFASARFPRDMAGLVLTGPFMPEEARRRVRALAAGRGDLWVAGFLPEPMPVLAVADRVVTMGWYNSVCEAMRTAGVRPLVVPRVHPRLEQWIRAERMAALGLLDVLPPSRLGPEALSAWLAGPGRAADAGVTIDFGGLRRVPALLAELLVGCAGLAPAAASSGAAERAARLGAAGSAHALP